MAWTSLADRHGIDLDGTPSGSNLTKLPLVLLGPMLRRVEHNSVSVFLVLRKAANVELTIHSKDIYDSLPNHVSLRGSAQTVQLGKNLHVVTITADIVDQSTLGPGGIYYYDIKFSGISSWAGEYRLEDLNVISTSSDLAERRAVLAYGNYPLPSFVLPASDINDLRILHGSCRKPHGGGNKNLGSDSLAGVDKIIENAYDQPAYRPQQLYLTGDQIYCDDVSATMLHLIRDAKIPLFGNSWNEDLGLIGFDTNKLSIGSRSSLIKNAAFTAFRDFYGVNHLIKLEEYITMYMFCWSDVLWPANTEDIPDIFDIEEFELPAQKLKDEMGSNKKFQTYMVYEYTNAGHVKVFRKTLGNVRRALANIATYMMFDDHDVTDDWFINYEWCEQVFANIRGKRIMQNALSAFAVFQAWGNTPARFNTGTNGATLLNRLNSLYSNNSVSNWNTIESLVIPDFQNDISLPTSGGYATSGKQLKGSSQNIKWTFNINFESFRVIVLNTRTRRGFLNISNDRDKLYPSRLLSSELMASDLSYEGTNISEPDVNQPLPLTILVSPAPVIGHRLVEGVGQPLKIRLQNSKYEKDKNKEVERGEFKLDFETWSGNVEAFSTLLNELIPYGKVVMLSGDVHYAFSAQVKMWNKSNQNAVFAQLTSSSSKNQDSTTLSSGTWKSKIGEAITSTNPELIENVFGWETSGRLYEERYISSLTFPKYFDYDTTDNLTVARETTKFANFYPLPSSTIVKIFEIPDWEYSTVFAIDKRNPSQRGIDNNDPPPNPFDIVRGHNYRVQFEDGQTAVGQNNIGEVTFNWDVNNSAYQVIHNLWYAIKIRSEQEVNLNKMLPYTKHVIDLSITPNKPSDDLIEE